MIRFCLNINSNSERNRFSKSTNIQGSYVTLQNTLFKKLQIMNELCYGMQDYVNNSKYCNVLATENNTKNMKPSHLHIFIIKIFKL